MDHCVKGSLIMKDGRRCALKINTKDATFFYLVFLLFSLMHLVPAVKVLDINAFSYSKVLSWVFGVI